MKHIIRRDFIKKGVATGLLISMNPLELARTYADQAHANRKILVFSKHLLWLDYDDTAKSARKIGFDGVDITVRPKGHVLPENVERDLPKAVEAIRKQGLIADTITTGFNSINDPVTERTIKTAAKLGIKQYRMGWIKYNPDKTILYFDSRWGFP